MPAPLVPDPAPASPVTASGHLHVAPDVARDPDAPLRRDGRARARARFIVPAADALAVSLAAAYVAPSISWGAAYVVLVLALGLAQHAYWARIAPSVYDAVPTVLAQAALPLLVLGPLAAARDAADVMWMPVAGFAALVAGRALSYATVRVLRRRGVILERTVIVGAGSQGVLIAQTLREHPEYGLRPVAFLDNFADELDPPIIGSVDALDEILERFAIDRVVVAFGGTREPEMVGVLRACDDHRVEVHVVPRFFELGVAPRSPDTEHIWGIPLMRLRRSALRPYARRVKRVFDVGLAALALVVLSPLMASIAVLVRISSPGPVLFRQKRVGQDDRVVEVLKFRSMPVNDDSDTTWNVAHDERLPTFGRIIRATSLDELPQLINVLRGEMSIVGPRPERPFFVEQFDAEIPRYADRHRLPGGITGWAQVHNLRGDTSIEERARFDNFYIEHWSLWRDVQIMLKTAAAIFRRTR